MDDDTVQYMSFESIPPETPIRLTDIWRNGGRYNDYGEGMYCSPEGKNSQRGRRDELWAIRQKTREELPGPVWFYCAEHLPSREWLAGDAEGLEVRVNEISCADCFLVVPVGSVCDETGKTHRAPGVSDRA